MSFEIESIIKRCFHSHRKKIDAMNQWKRLTKWKHEKNQYLFDSDVIYCRKLFVKHLCVMSVSEDIDYRITRSIKDHYLHKIKYKSTISDFKGHSRVDIQHPYAEMRKDLRNRRGEHRGCYDCSLNQG